MNKYLSYTFLYEDSGDLRCDFEIFTDEISSMIGLLRSLVKDESLRDDLTRANGLMYHINPSLRTRVAVTGEELAWLDGKTEALRAELQGGSAERGGASPAGGGPRPENSGPAKGPRFVLPQGCAAASLAHVIRNRCKALVRLLSRHRQQGHKTEEILFDFINLFSGYFFFLALKLNRDSGIEELEFKSRVYS
jgi:cob(I)alamin adenosyltransferase